MKNDFVVQREGPQAREAKHWELQWLSLQTGGGGGLRQHFWLFNVLGYWKSLDRKIGHVDWSSKECVLREK